MRFLPLRAVVALVALAVAPLAATRSGPRTRPPRRLPVPSSCDIRTTERIVAVADIHGAFDRFVRILQKVGIIDAQSHWSGGKTVFLQLGDVIDRGADSRKALDLLRSLETEAAAAGGQVHALLGNHEVMRMMNDYRYVSTGEYAAFVTPTSSKLRDRYYAAAVDIGRQQAEAAGKTFDEKGFTRQLHDETPLGKVEMANAFGPAGEYGTWLRGHDVMARVNGIVFLHGGTNPAVAKLGCAAINTQARSELQNFRSLSPDELAHSLIASETGPVWFRGLAYDRLQEFLIASPDSAPETLLKESDVDAILSALGGRAIVIGHTVAEDAKARWRFNRRVVQLDSGMLDGAFFPGGSASALEIVGDTFTLVYENRREVLGTPHTPASDTTAVPAKP